MKKFICFVLIAATLAAGILVTPTLAAEVPADEPMTLAELNAIVAVYEKRMADAHEMAECARRLGLNDTDVIKLAKREYNAAKAEVTKYKVSIAAIKANKKYEEYPEAAYVWDYFTSLGYSEAATAGLLGNMMVECGGWTLALNPFDYSYGAYYYGICQWNKGAYPEIHGASLEEQCDYLEATIEKEYAEFGYAYMGYRKDDFKKMTNPQAAADCFRVVYERPGPGDEARRRICAQRAYDYFTRMEWLKSE